MAFLSGFGKRKAIKYGTIFPDSSLSDFPKLFVIEADSDIASELSGGGGIAVTEADGETPVPFGLYPSSDPSSGDIILRAKFDIAAGASTGDTLGYIYYDSGQSTTEDKAGTVDNDYVLFMPLEEDPSGSAPQMFDWVSETNIGTSGGSMASGNLVAGEVGNALGFDGFDDLITVASLAYSAAITGEAIIKRVALNRGFSTILSHHTTVGVPSDWYFYFHDDNKLHVDIPWVAGFVVDGATALTDTSDFHSVAFTRAGSSGSWHYAVYLDGVPDGTDTDSNNPTTSTHPLHIMALVAGNNHANGYLDEVRISSVARSAAWLEYAHYDDFDNSDTFTLGTEEVDGGVTPTVNTGNFFLVL